MFSRSRCSYTTPQTFKGQDIVRMATIHIGNNDYEDVQQEFPDKGSGYFTRPLSAVRRIIIHHSATPGGETTVAREKATIGAIYNYHTGKHLWPGIGYHAMVFMSGRIYITGGAEDIRYHASAQNGDSYGICLIGDFTSLRPLPVQLAKTRQLVEDVNKGLGRVMSISKHRDFGGTACPGDTWPQWMEQITSGVVVPEPSAPDNSSVVLALNTIWGTAEKMDAIRSGYAVQLKDAVVVLKKALGIP